MIPRGPTAQLDLFAAPAPVTALAEAHADEEMVAELVANGLADRYSVSLGYHPRDPLHAERPAPWNVPSRLFRFPYRFHRPAGGSTRIRLKHPALSGHPHIVFLAERTGFPVEVDPRDQEAGAWQHAIDLCSDADWRTLLDLRHFTTRAAIAAAVSVALRSPRLSLANARRVLAAIDCPEPLDRSAAILIGVRRDEHKGTGAASCARSTCSPPIATGCRRDGKPCSSSMAARTACSPSTATISSGTRSTSGGSGEAGEPPRGAQPCHGAAEQPPAGLARSYRPRRAQGRAARHTRRRAGPRAGLLDQPQGADGRLLAGGGGLCGAHRPRPALSARRPGRPVPPWR